MVYFQDKHHTADDDIYHEMITTVKLININPPIAILNCCVCVSVCVRTLKVYSPSKLQVNTLFTIVTMLYIRFLEPIHFTGQSSHPLANISLISPTLTTAKHLLTLCHHGFIFFQIPHMQLRSHTIYHCVWFILLSVVSSHFIHIVASEISCFYDQLLFHCMSKYIPSFLHPFIYQQELSYFLILAIVNNATLLE